MDGGDYFRKNRNLVVLTRKNAEFLTPGRRAKLRIEQLELPQHFFGGFRICLLQAQYLVVLGFVPRIAAAAQPG